MKYDVVCFGSAAYDIYVKSDEFKLRKADDGVMLCEMYGKKILLDEFITTSGGGATNAAVCFERMGLQAGLVACVGRDHRATTVRSKLAEEGVSLIHLQTTSKKPTSSSIVLVGSDGGRTVLVQRAASNELSWHKVDWKRLDAQWLYVSSLGGDFTLLSKIIKLAKDKDIKVAFNPGGGELANTEKLHYYIQFVEMLLLNKQEALGYFHKKSTSELDHHDVCTMGPKMVIVTSGRKGSTLYSKDGQVIKQKRIKVKTVEETGAGDSFGSGFVAGQLKDLSIKQSLALAAHNSASVVIQIGPKAGLLFWPEAKKQLKL